MGKKLSCNHVRSYKYFIETVNSPNKFWAVECKSWEDYRAGNCFKCDYNQRFRNGTQCARFGFHSITSFANRTSLLRHRNSRTDFMLNESPVRRYISMYLITGDSEPFYSKLNFYTDKPINWIKNFFWNLKNDFCITGSQYRVNWKISESSHEIGKFKLKIIGKDGETEFMDLTDRYEYLKTLLTRAVNEIF